MTSEEFTRHRRAAGLTYRAAAAALGVALSSIYRWEHGDRRIPSDAADRIRELANMVTTIETMTGEWHIQRSERLRPKSPVYVGVSWCGQELVRRNVSRRSLDDVEYCCLDCRTAIADAGRP